MGFLSSSCTCNTSKTQETTDSSVERRKNKNSKPLNNTTKQPARLFDPKLSKMYIYKTIVCFLLLHTALCDKSKLKITEIMYAPRLLDGDLEYIEIWNDSPKEYAHRSFSYVFSLALF